MKTYDIVIIGEARQDLGGRIRRKWDSGYSDPGKRKELGGILNQCIHNGFGLIHLKRN